MSIFFADEMTVEEPKAPPEPAQADYEKALASVAVGKAADLLMISAVLGKPVGTVYEMSDLCRKIEPTVLRMLAEDADDVMVLDWIVGVVPDWFPSEKFLAIMQEHAGGSFADLATAAKRVVERGKVQPIGDGKLEGGKEIAP